ncbi:MAG: hypothetical protein ABI406_10630 [Ktedonobacteraceae bacterium]
MQTATRERTTGTGSANHTSTSSPSQSIAIVAVILFALSGLISGFAIGAFIHPPRSPQTNTNTSGTTPPIAQQSPVSTKVTHTVKTVPLGWPVIKDYNDPEIADGNTTYTFSAYPVDQSVDTGHGKQVNATGITCKVWLIQRIPGTSHLSLPIPTLQDISAIQSPLTGTAKGQQYTEISGLTFDTSTPQIHACNASGVTTWNYQIDTTVAPGKYNLVVLTDWDGKRFNWSWADIVIKKAD